MRRAIISGSGKNTAGAWTRIFNILLVLALAAVILPGCRREQPKPPAQGWVRLAALQSLHPNRAMLTDIDRRLATLAAQRARLLEHPTLPLPPDTIPLDTPALAPLPSPAGVEEPAWPTLPPAPKIAELRTRLTEDMTRQYLRLQQDMAAQRSAEYLEKERALRRQADGRRTDIAREYGTRIPNANVRVGAAAQQATRAKKDADMARAQAELARESAKEQEKAVAAAPADKKRLKTYQEAQERLRQLDQRAERLEEHARQQRATADDIARQLAEDLQTLKDAQAKVLAELRDELAGVDRQLTGQMNARLAAWRAQAEEKIERQLAERTARLEEENAPRANLPSPAPLAMPEIATRPLTTSSAEMRIAVNQTRFSGFQSRLQAVRAIDDVVHQLTLERLALEESITRDTRLAAHSAAAQHGWRIQFDQPVGKDVTDKVHTWLSAYWPPAE